MGEIRKLSDLVPDPENANKGTERGTSMLEDSIRQYGAGRSVLVDKYGVVIAGNKTLDAALMAGLDNDAIVVKTDGHKLVVVQRTDLDLSKDERAKALGVADNRVSEVGLSWDAQVLTKMVDDGVNLSEMFSDNEIAKLLDKEEREIKPQLEKALQVKPGVEYCVVICGDEMEWEEMKGMLGLGLVRRGGYRHGSPFDAVGTQRVVRWADMKKKMVTA